MDYSSEKIESARQSGNKCGHLLFSPKVFKEPKGHKKRPYLNIEGRRRLRQTYYNPYKYDAGKMAYHSEKLNQDGGKRKMRSEIRDAITHSVGEALLHYGNVTAMAVGFTDPKTNKFIHLGITKIAAKAGISYERTRSALRKFEEAETIIIEQTKHENKDGEIRNNSSFIQLTKQFFYNLGFDDIDIKNYRSKYEADLERKLVEQKRLSFNKNKRLDKKLKKGDKLNKKTNTSLKRPAYADFKSVAPRFTRCDTKIALEAIKAIKEKINTS